MATHDLEKRVGNIEETLRELATVPARLGGLEGQVGGLVHQVGRLEGQVGRLEGQVGRLEGQVGSLEGRVGGLETQFLQSREEVRREFSAVHEGQERLGSQMRMLYEDLVERIKRLGEGGTFLGGRS